MSDLDIKSGDLITVTYEEREFAAIVIDPDSLGPGQPSAGFGFMMAQKHIGGFCTTPRKGIVHSKTYKTYIKQEFNSI